MEKIYTQEDMDNITSKVKERQAEKYAKTHIELAKYQELETKYNELINTNKINSFKETFKANGGNMDAYNDFISTNKDILDLEGDKLTQKLNELKETKKYFFNSSTPTPNQTIFNESKELQELTKDIGEERVGETIYKKKWL